MSTSLNIDNHEEKQGAEFDLTLAVLIVLVISTKGIDSHALFIVYCLNMLSTSLFKCKITREIMKIMCIEHTSTRENKYSLIK